jgi:hypothetical protein
LKFDGIRTETRFRLSAKRTSPFKSVWVSVQSTTGSRGVRISGSNAGYTKFRGSMKITGYPLHSPVSPSFPLPCVTVCHHFSTGLYFMILNCSEQIRRFSAWRSASGLYRSHVTARLTTSTLKQPALLFTGAQMVCCIVIWIRPLGLQIIPPVSPPPLTYPKDYDNNCKYSCCGVRILAAYYLIYPNSSKGYSPMFNVNCTSLVATCFTLTTIMGPLIVLEYVST